MEAHLSTGAVAFCLLRPLAVVKASSEVLGDGGMVVLQEREADVLQGERRHRDCVEAEVCGGKDSCGTLLVLSKQGI